MTAQAQEAWTLDRVMREALTNHPLMQEKRAAQAAAKADLDGAKWQRYPTPSFEANTANHGGGTLRIDQPLWTGGRITANLDMAQAKLDVADALVRETGLDVANKVIAAVVEAVRQAQRRQYAEAGVHEHEKLLDMIQRRVTQEVSSNADQRLAASRLYGSRNDLSLSVQAWNNALVQVGQLVGQSVGSLSDVGLNPNGLKMPSGVAEALSEALSRSARLRRLEHEERMAEAEIDTKRAAWWPQLVYRFERARAAQTMDSRSMLVLQAQPGAGLSASSGVDAALARRDAARQMRQMAERDINEQVAQLWNDWRASSERVLNATEARSMSADVAASYARQYTAGRKSWLDVLNAVRESTQSELAVVDAQAQSMLAAWKLRALMGALSTDDGEAAQQAQEKTK